MASLGHYSSRSMPSSLYVTVYIFTTRGLWPRFVHQELCVVPPGPPPMRNFSDTVCASDNVPLVPFRFSRVTVPLESFKNFTITCPAIPIHIADDDAPVHLFPLYMKYGRNFLSTEQICDSLKGVVTST